MTRPLADIFGIAEWRKFRLKVLERRRFCERCRRRGELVQAREVVINRHCHVEALCPACHSALPPRPEPPALRSGDERTREIEREEFMKLNGRV
jgi:hypothetical protein